MMKHRALLLSVVVAAAGVAHADEKGADKAADKAAAKDDSVIVDRVIAVVDNSIVLSSEVEAVLEGLNKAQPMPDGIDKVAAMNERRAQVLESLIAEKLLDAEVKKLRVDVTPAEVDRVVLQTKTENNLTDEQLQMALGRQGMTLEEYRDQLKKQLTKMKIVQIKVKSRVNVSDADVKTAQMQKDKAAKSLGFSRVRARHILWLAPPTASAEQIEAAKAKALSAFGRLNGGADFAAIAEAESEDPGSKSRGGDLGAFGRGEMVPEFERVAFEAPIGKVVGPVRTAFGWHLIIVDEHIADVVADPEKAAREIRENLYQVETETQFKQYIDELKREAFIEKRL